MIPMKRLQEQGNGSKIEAGIPHEGFIKKNGQETKKAILGNCPVSVGMEGEESREQSTAHTGPEAGPSGKLSSAGCRGTYP